MRVKKVTIKPSIIALAITAAVGAPACALAASGDYAAPAYTATQTKGEMVYQNDDTAISIMGSVRLMAKDDSAHSVEHNIQNNDSRLGVALRQKINDKGYYAVGYYETGMHGLDSATDDQGNDVYTRQAYAGLGNDQYGVVTFGKQYAPTDWGLGIDTTYAWGGKAKHDTAGMSTDIINSAAIYYYTTDAFTVGVMGQGNDDVDKIGFGSGYGDGPDMHDAYHDGSATVHGGAALAAQYRFENGFSVSGAAAYNNYTVNQGTTTTDMTYYDQNGNPMGTVPVTNVTGPTYDGNTYSMGLNAKYTANLDGFTWYNAAQATYYINKVNDVQAAVSGTSNATDDRETILGLEYASQFKITPEWSIYANFDWTEGGDAMDGQHFQSTTLGADYWLGKNAVTYIEYGYEKASGNTDDSYNVSDHLAAVGLRIFI